jgi:catechol 2,3-dioxygenase-like lactoylglutathione lyase family enzyme
MCQVTLATMTDLPIERPARRFLHVCYCCADAAEASDFFVEGLKMKNTMRTTDQYGPGAILGIDRDVRSIGSFVFDRRGPRTSPAIEVQGWIDPEPVGEPSTDPFEVGIKAIGIAVPSVEEAVARLTGMGCKVLFDGTSPFGDRHATLLDPRQIILELVEDGHLDPEHTQMHHLRITVADLEESLPFYDMLGFAVVERGRLEDAAFVGSNDDGSAGADFARVRLPDEPFELRLIQWNTPSGHGRHYAEPNHAGIFRAALGVDDTRGSYERMRAAGAVFDRPPLQVELTGTPVPDMWITFISDPNGIPYEFVQRPRDAFR